MKRIILYFLLALLILAPVDSFARTRLLTSAPVYKGTITALRVSAVDGTAFIDNANESVTALADGNHSIEIYDSSNRMLKGVLKAAGTSEGLGDDVFTPLDFTNAPNWGTINATVNDADTFTTTDANGRVYTNSVATTLAIGALYKSSFSANETTGTSSLSNVFSVIDGSSNVYNTSVSTILRIGNTTNSAVVDVTTLSVQQVLTPSALGATIVSAKAGETYNFSYKNPSFTYNSSSYYCIIKAIR